MLHESGMIRKVAWEELFPWLMIPRAVQLAASMPVFFVATLGVLLMPVGWWGAGWVLSPEQRTAVTASGHLPESRETIGVSFPISRTHRIFSPELPDFYAPMLSAARSLVDPLL